MNNRHHRILLRRSRFQRLVRLGTLFRKSVSAGTHGTASTIACSDLTRSSTKSHGCYKSGHLKRRLENVKAEFTPILLQSSFCAQPWGGLLEKDFLCGLLVEWLCSMDTYLLSEERPPDQVPLISLWQHVGLVSLLRLRVAGKMFDVAFSARLVNVLIVIANGPSHLRGQVVRALGMLRSAAAPAVPQLASMTLVDNSTNVLAAIHALQALGAVAAPAVLVLLTSLNQKSAELRIRAARTLGSLGIVSTPAVLPLANALSDNRFEVRVSVAKALGQLGVVAAPAVPHLLRALKDVSADVREAAVMAFAELGAEATSAVQTIALLAYMDSDGKVRRRAVMTLRKLSDVAGIAMPGLAEALWDGRPRVRKRASQALHDLGPTAAPAVPMLMKALVDEDASVRFGAARALGGLGVKAAPAVKGLMQALVSGHRPDLRASAAEALCSIGASLASAVPQLVTLLTDSRVDVRAQAARVLGSIGKLSVRAAAPLTRTALEDESPLVRHRAKLALVEVAPAIPKLAEAIAEKSSVWESWGSVEDLMQLQTIVGC